MRKNVILHFGAELTDKPIMSGMIRAHDVTINILQASITLDQAGTMYLQIEGEPDCVRGALDYLEETGIRLLFPKKTLIWDEELCTHCGACIGQCLPKALSAHQGTGRISLDHDSCLACELCIPACPYGALESVGEHLGEEP